MDYFLLIITGILAIIGVLTETHKKVKQGGKVKKILSFSGWITLMGLAITLALSVTKQFFDNKEKERINEENNYLKFSELPVGPNIVFHVIFSDSLIANVPPKETPEKTTLKNEQIALFKKSSKPESWPRDSMDSIRQINTATGNVDKFYIDSFSRESIFHNKDFNNNKNKPIATLNLRTGLIAGNISFINNGMISQNCFIDKMTAYVYSVLAGEYNGSANCPIIPCTVYYSKKDIYFFCKIKDEIHGGSFYGALLKEYETKVNSSSLDVFFDSLPSKTLISEVNKSLNKIKKFQIEISYDPLGVKWLIVPYELDNGYKISTKKDQNGVSYVLSRVIKLSKLPYIGNPDDEN